MPTLPDTFSMPDIDAMYRLGRWLTQQAYRFVTVTPATHARVLARDASRDAVSLRDVFGWSRPFRREAMPPEAFALLERSGALLRQGALFRSGIRYSTLHSAFGELLFAHSAYPTREADAVFFGPDTWRFAALIEQTLAVEEVSGIRRILDVGCGAGPGGIVAAQWLRAQSPELVLADINPRALAHAEANAALAGVARTRLVQGDLFEPVEGAVDLILANPPYLVDAQARTYRHGGGDLGCGLSLRIVAEGIPRLSPGGMLILYTGAPVADGLDVLHAMLEPVLQRDDLHYSYREIDPDVFGEELEEPAYAHAERIAAIALVIRRRR